MPEPVEIDGLELVLENFHNLFLGKLNKLEGEICNLEGGSHLINLCHFNQMGL